MRPIHFAVAAGILALGVSAIPGVIGFFDYQARAESEAPKPHQAGKQGKELGGWRAPKEARAVANPVAMTPESVARGQLIYDKSCARCHGPEGHGDGRMAKSLKTKPADLALRLPFVTDGEVFWKLTQGKSPMPSFKKDLTDEQRWDVVNTMRHMLQVTTKEDSTESPAGASPATGSGN